MEELRRVLEELGQRLRAFCREQPKQAAEVGALALLLCFAAALFLWENVDDERLALKQPPSSAPADAKQNSPSRLEVKGVDEAEATGELRNPFSMLHETRAEMVAAPKPVKEAKPQAAEKNETANEGSEPCFRRGRCVCGRAAGTGAGAQGRCERQWPDARRHPRGRQEPSRFRGRGGRRLHGRGHRRRQRDARWRWRDARAAAARSVMCHP